VSQCPARGITPPRTSSASARIAISGYSPAPRSPPSASTGIGSLRAACSRLCAMSVHTEAKYEKPARSAPGFCSWRTYRSKSAASIASGS
jgi:hypothetical protein